MRTTEEATRFLTHKSKDLGAFTVCEPIFSNPNFVLWTGSSKPTLHHYGKGQLVVHTAEVVELCLQCNQTLQAGINEAELFLAAFFHDVGKLEDYAPVDGDQEDWGITEHRILIHHITRSVLYFVECLHVSKHIFSKEVKDRIIHAILSHHGRKEWGSPVEPKTKMAHMLHFCDAISARMNDADKNPIISIH